MGGSEINHFITIAWKKELLLKIHESRSLVKMKTYYALIMILFSAVQIFQTAGDTCNNGGTELPGGSHPKCSCPDGFKGFDCNQTVSPCEGRPCRNDGECIEHENGTFTCICTSKYTGILCEKQFRPCDSDPCKNGGNCSDDGEKCFKCECTDGYKGSDCSEKITPCEVFPCKNGGVCVNQDGGFKFKCVCKEGFGGIFCERIDHLYSSNVLEGKQNYVDKLEEYLGVDEQWRLCYRASDDGWTSKNFHDRCDHRGPTVTLVSVGSNKDLHIFGGYTDISWGGTTGYKQSTKSFLFSLRNKKQAFKSPIYRNYVHAIYTNPGYGATFGAGHDLYLVNNANANSNSYSRLGQAYKPPFGYTYNTKQSKEIMAGTFNFRPTEIEVYYRL